MHELYATQAILDKAIEQASEQMGARITDLYLVLGEISSYAQDSIQFYWDDISTGTIADGARLHFRHVEAEMQCMACFTKYRPQDGEILCPNCGSTGAKIVAGEDLYLEGIDLD
jgi:hydrogenase nickel incorporation protein HypA/HybF